MKKLNTLEFVEKLKAIQPKLTLIGDYIGAESYVVVKDELDIEYRVKPYNLLMGKKPSSSSAVDKTKAFNTRLKKVFPDLIAERYEKGAEKITVLDELGIRYLVSSGSVLLGNYPSIQTAIDKNEAFNIIASKIHNNKYNYKKVIYMGMNDKVIIDCAEHGEFIQKPSNHLQGQGCRKCADEAQHEFMWTREYWNNLCNSKKDSNPKVYIVKLFNSSENFIKIGMTSTDIHYRLKFGIPYNYEVLSLVHDTSDNVFNLEKELHKLLSNYRYKPLIKFAGNYECFKYKECLEILIKEKLV